MSKDTHIDRKHFDMNVKPTDDFFTFINGVWLAENPIPPDEQRWGSFMILRKGAKKALYAIVQDLARRDDLSAGSPEKKVQDFFFSAMDAQKLNAQGYRALDRELHLIDGMRSADDIVRVLAHLHQRGIDPLWGPYVWQDQKKSDLMTFYLAQGGLGLPDRDYYTKTDAASEEIRGKYREHIGKVLGLAGRSEQERAQNTAAIMRIETALAEASMTQVELRDPEKQYNKRTVAALVSEMPRLNWSIYFSELGLPADMSELIVSQPLFFKAVDDLFGTIPLSEWKTYLLFHLANGCASRLGDDAVDQEFDFYGRTLTGAKEQKPRWERAMGAFGGSLGQALGKLYVKRHFSEEAKHKINKLVDTIIEAYRDRISRLDWMGDATKARALEKLAAVTRKLGYPDVWRDCSAMVIDRGSYVRNWMNANLFEWRRMAQKIGGPPDRTEWYWPPQTVNAGYYQTLNEIIFPAAIMQPPFFDPDADDALNYAGIGAVIGHELTHGFDDKGSQFDASGNLSNWWTAGDRKRFDEKAEVLVRQFEECVVVDDLRVNGKLTLGENIADLGGIMIAYDALQKALERGGRPPLIDGFTPEERFFINWAQVWRGQARDETRKLQLHTDPHSPEHLRANMPLSNMAEFYTAFACRPGDALYREPEKRAVIW